MCVCGGNRKGGNMEGVTNKGRKEGIESSDAGVQNKGPLMRRHLSYGLPDNNSVKNYILFFFCFLFINTHTYEKKKSLLFLSILIFFSGAGETVA